MVKDNRKIYKAVRKTIDDNKDNLVIKFKNLRPIDIRELRNEINLLTTDFFVQEEQDYLNDSARLDPDDKEVHFQEFEKKSCLKQNGKKTRETTSR